MGNTWSVIWHVLNPSPIRAQSAVMNNETIARCKPSGLKAMKVAGSGRSWSQVHGAYLIICGP